MQIQYMMLHADCWLMEQLQSHNPRKFGKQHFGSGQMDTHNHMHRPSRTSRNTWATTATSHWRKNYKLLWEV